MRVEIIEVLSDNYAYLLIDDESRQALAVDPAEVSPVMIRAENMGISIVGILTTHKHWDHAGGNVEMAGKIPGLVVYGGRIDDVAACTEQLDDGAEVQLGKIKISALHTPGHTAGSTCYYCTEGDESQGVVFTGDTMFVGGCGRIFECTPADLYNSLMKLGQLPATTQVYVGHEYTLKNLEFATAQEAGNQDLQQFVEWAKEQRLQRKATVPSTMINEWRINPFLRSGGAEMKSICPGCAMPELVFAELRRRKDNF
mmetsp:Transcript_39558/g.113387  ORF Transcript_39558/g.113387 Transcript_39558/m.113387 type:complete len:256 (-) Transcript_39558:41-808(-)